MHRHLLVVLPGRNGYSNSLELQRRFETSTVSSSKEARNLDDLFSTFAETTCAQGT
jgi:hypothetical protein